MDVEPGPEGPTTVTHEDREVLFPAATRKVPPPLKEGTYYTMHFDGGCRNRLGTGGWVLFDCQMQVMVARSEWYADKRPTVNTAEMAALVSGLNAARPLAMEGGK